MLGFASERLLLIGDARRELQQALADAAPGARVTSVATGFDGIAELTAEPGDAYTTGIAAAEPLGRRGGAGARGADRGAAGGGRGGAAPAGPGEPVAAVRPRRARGAEPQDAPV